MSNTPPQEKVRTFNAAIATTYPGAPQIDISSPTTGFRSQGWRAVNHSSNRIIFFSFDGVTDSGITLDPAVEAGFVLDSFHPIGGKIWARSDAGTPTLEMVLFA